ncbi:MAG: hypothetical protein ACK47T_08225, partial [Brevundimonas sp.]
GGEADTLAAAVQRQPSERAEPGEDRGVHRCLGEQQELIVEAPVNAPVFTRFRALGWLTLDSGGERVGLAAQAVSVGEIERYFKRCE